MTAAAAREFLIIGRGRSGCAAARLIDSFGGRSYIFDDHVSGRQPSGNRRCAERLSGEGFSDERPSGDSQLGASGPSSPGLPPSSQLVDAEQARGLLARVESLLPSPGVAASHPLIIAARAAGLPVVSEPELAFASIKAPLIAVTGTNGKSTTVKLLAAIFEQSGKRVFAGGNLGRPLCEAAAGDWDLVIAEMSSFQLEWVHAFKPSIAALLNVSPDHLDRHGNMEAYLAAKLRLFARMDAGCHAVIGAGWWFEKAASGLCAGLSSFAGDGADAREIGRCGGGVPAADDGVRRGDGAVAAQRIHGNGAAVPAARGAGRRGSGGAAVPPVAGTVADRGARKLYCADDFVVELPQQWPWAVHDFANAAAAAEIARVGGLGREFIEAGFRAFEPLGHRLHKVADAGGVSYWNDSKATNTAAVLSVLDSFRGNVILLAGGVSKNSDFTSLARAREKIKLLLAYGSAGAEIEEALGGSLPLRRCDGFEAAFAAAVAAAGKGDAVVLAPGCASFDEFADYRARGARFEQLVSALPGAARSSKRR